MKYLIQKLINDKDKLFRVLSVAVICFIAIEIVYYVFFLDSIFDEAIFGYKSWLTAQNLAWPFRDFGNKYPQVAFFSQMVLQGLFGPSILSSRILSALFL